MLVPVAPPEQAPASYLARQAYIASLSTGVDSTPVPVEYTAEENGTWRSVQELLDPVWNRYAAPELLEARQAIDLPRNEIPQLALVTERVEPLTGFRFASVPGTVSGHAFFGALADRVFSSTQFIRWSGSPGYTPEPDVLHEVGGHANALANPVLAQVHQLAGQASLAAPALIDTIAAVFWYSVEFGVVRSNHEWKAYGAGLLSSPGELGWFADHADIRPLDIDQMMSTPYDISAYQPVLFGAESLDQVLDVVGGYFASVIDDPVAAGATRPAAPGPNPISEQFKITKE